MYSHSRFQPRYNSRFQSKPRQSFAGKRSSFNPTAIASQAPKQMVEQPIFVPKHAFADFNISEDIKRNISRKNYATPTPIQDQVIPAILEGHDVIGIANTGTGKTAAFLIPLIEKVLKNPSEKVLIVAPTRELAVQIQDEMISFCQGMRIYSVLCIGGVGIGRQQINLMRPHNFIIGTPGRIKDFINQRKLDLANIHSVVLDEADHMVDIGFIRDIQFIVAAIPKTRQSLFFSATIDGKVKEILKEFVTNPITVSVKSGETAENISQKIVKVNPTTNKVDQLHDMLIQKEYEKVLIFGRTKWGIQKLTNELIDRGFKAGVIHGNKSQNQRLTTLQNFKTNKITILLATDVASRGLDIPEVSHVINYDLPETRDAYIHRIGRTGRADKKGIAITFV